MRVLVDDRWEDGYLDYWRGPGELRLQVRRWLCIEELEGLYFEFEPRDNLRKLWNYGRELGPVEVARKVASRLTERGRNRKWLAVGVGEVLEGDDPGALRAFVAPCHPRCVERIVVPGPLTAPWDGDDPEPTLRWSEGELPAEIPPELPGWQRESAVEPHLPSGFMTAVIKALKSQAWEDAVALEGDTSPVREQRPVSRAEDGTRSGTLFGWGHYARSCVVPSLPDQIRIDAVHELDPVLSTVGPITDTSPEFRHDERPDVVLVAGYHASHAALAAEALRRGASVLCEKPLATTQRDLEALLAAWVEPSRLFAGFQRRYAPYNEWLREDLRPSEDDPLSYHCLVHEVSLPANHWYDWPSSGSRLLSNGCHWIDHFLHLNAFADVAEADARRIGTEVVVTIELSNGAVFTMTLTDRGSDRLGTREHTEVRVGDRTAVIEDGSRYRAEGGERLIRREKFHKLAAHEAMVRSIGERIVRGEPGDSRRSVERSAGLVLRLERSLSES